MVKIRNISTGPRGAWQGATLVMAEPGEVIEADDFEPEWFEEIEAKAPAKGKAKAAPVKPEAEPEE
jgi:hypothetical protein